MGNKVFDLYFMGCERMKTLMEEGKRVEKLRDGEISYVYFWGGTKVILERKMESVVKVFLQIYLVVREALSS